MKCKLTWFFLLWYNGFFFLRLLFNLTHLTFLPAVICDDTVDDDTKQGEPSNQSHDKEESQVCRP